MISINCDIREFITGLENKDFFEMIYLLDKEATDAERQLYNPKSEMSERQMISNHLFRSKTHRAYREVESADTGPGIQPGSGLQPIV
jgi:hypothetical protein